MSIEGGLHKAFDRIRFVRGESLQIFSKNQRQWGAPPLTAREIEQFQRAWEQWGQGPVAVHDSYLINLANPDSKNQTGLLLPLPKKYAGPLCCPYPTSSCTPVPTSGPGQKMA
jgi:deoxyribonuclease-4